MFLAFSLNPLYIQASLLPELINQDSSQAHPLLLVFTQLQNEYFSQTQKSAQLKIS
jgi:hypothetical protein